MVKASYSRRTLLRRFETRQVADRIYIRATSNRTDFTHFPVTPTFAAAAALPIGSASACDEPEPEHIPADFPRQVLLEEEMRPARVIQTGADLLLMEVKVWWEHSDSDTLLIWLSPDKVY